MELTHGSLFSGIGGFDLGFERTGFTTLWQVEIDDYATKVLEKHWPNVRRYRDITTIDWRTVPVPTVLTGGFPCQDISVAGKGAGITGARSGLWSYFHRAISILRPHYVVVENVSALIFRGMGRVLGDLSEIGYDAEWEVIPAYRVGAPHERMRTFIVAYPQSLGHLRQQAETRIFSQNVQKPYRCGLTETWGRATYRGQSGRVFHCPDGGIPGVAHGIPYWMDGRMKSIGNAVVPQIAEEIAWMIRRVEETHD